MDYLLDKFLDIVFWIVKGVIGILPTYSPDNPGSTQSLFNALSSFNDYIPIVEMAECVIAYLAFCALYLGLKPILKLAHIT